MPRDAETDVFSQSNVLVVRSRHCAMSWWVSLMIAAVADHAVRQSHDVAYHATPPRESQCNRGGQLTRGAASINR
jgi:hypothetical protein